jgi:hypothetical protein
MTYWNGSGWEAERPAEPPRARRGRRILGAATEAGLITLLMLGLIAGTALAAPGGGKGGGGKTSGGTIQYYLLDGSDALANHTERVAFTVATSATDRPFVGVRCWQGTNFVLDGYTGYFPTYMFEPWVALDSSYWVAGEAANCTARLFHYDKRGNQKILATVDFTTLP